MKILGPKVNYPQNTIVAFMEVSRMRKKIICDSLRLRPRAEKNLVWGDKIIWKFWPGHETKKLEKLGKKTDPDFSSPLATVWFTTTPGTLFHIDLIIIALTMN